MENGNGFVGSGLAFPLRVDASGSFALVSHEREIEEAIRIVLGTAPGERPMRPEFGCGIHDYVFSPANATTAGLISDDVRAALARWEPRIEVAHVDVYPDADEPALLYVDIHYRVRAHERPAQPRLSLLHDPRPKRPCDDPSGSEPRRPPLPGPRRRREAAASSSTARSGRDHNVSRPGRDADRAVRLDDRPAPLPAEPRPGPQLRQVPRVDRRHAVSAERRPVAS